MIKFIFAVIVWTAGLVASLFVPEEKVQIFYGTCYLISAILLFF